MKVNSKCWNCTFRFELNAKKPYSLLPDFEQRVFKCGKCGSFMLVFAGGRCMNPLKWPHLREYPELLAQMGEAKPLRVVPINKAADSKEAPEIDTSQLVLDRKPGVNEFRHGRVKIIPKVLAEQESTTFDIRDEKGRPVKDGAVFKDLRLKRP